jgi:hypothetical protein
MKRIYISKVVSEIKIGYSFLEVFLPNSEVEYWIVNSFDDTSSQFVNVVTGFEITTWLQINEPTLNNFNSFLNSNALPITAKYSKAIQYKLTSNLR